MFKKIKDKMKMIKEKLLKKFSGIKWFFDEILKMYSSQPSYFSKKRVESGVAFLISQFGMIFFLVKKIESMDVYEFSIWAAMEFLVAGYTVSQIQREKKNKEPEVISETE